jgi:hypothetical protein
MFTPMPGTAVSTDRSGLIRSFPWRTAVLLAADRQALVLDALERSNHRQEVRDMIQASFQSSLLPRSRSSDVPGPCSPGGRRSFVDSP